MAQHSGSPAPAPPHPDRAAWRRRVEEWYPRWRERTYFVPPVLMNRTDHPSLQLAGQPVQVAKAPDPLPPPGSKAPIQTSDVLNDVTQQRVLHCLRGLALAKKEVMFVFSNLEFQDYLSNDSYNAAAKTLPRPATGKFRRGDFDILVVHRDRGLLACEVKAVGACPASVGQTGEQERAAIEDRLRRAVRQLHKAGDVLRHLVSDLPTPQRVQVSLMVPNVTEARLRQVLADSPSLMQDLCKCLGLSTTDDPVPWCVTSDQLSDVNRPYDVTNDVIRHLGQWWKTVMPTDGGNSGSSDNTYLELLARFGGPATTFRVFCTATPRLCMDVIRTEGEGASETGNRFTQVMLTQQQVAIHHQAEPLVILAGPPGVGKSLMLVLRGLDWLGDDKHVDVVSTWKRSLAATHAIAHQLKETAGPSGAQRVHQHHLDLDRGEQGVQTAVKTLVNAANRDGSKGLYVIADEACEKDEFKDMVVRLHSAVPSLHLWAANVEQGERAPCMTQFTLTLPLRSPPSVTRHVQLSNTMREGRVRDYATPTWPAHTDGPPPMVLNHCGRGHTVGWMPHECVACGTEVARLLTEDLHVGKAVSERPSPSGAPTLQYRDVFVLSYKPMSLADGFVAGLQKSKLPFTVLETGDATAAEDVAARRTDAVVVASHDDVHGLERKVVVWVQGHKLSRANTYQGPDEDLGRLYAMSRCTAQLVCVMPTQSEQCNCCVC